MDYWFVIGCKREVVGYRLESCVEVLECDDVGERREASLLCFALLDDDDSKLQIDGTRREFI